MKRKRRKKIKPLTPEQATKEYMERIKKIFPAKYFTKIENSTEQDKGNKCQDQQ
jgi:hypothetical protein